MAIQNKTLSGAEHDFFATLSGLSPNAPLNEHKAKVFSDAGHGGVGKPLTQMEREWIQKLSGSSKLNEGDLWRELVASIGIAPSVSTAENKFLFYSSPVALLQGYIRTLSGLVAYYPLNETAGNAINRAPATLGTLNGSVTGTTQGVSGLVGNAYSFDGTNDQVRLSSSSIIATEANSSIFLLFKSNTVPAGTSGDTIYTERGSTGNAIFKLEVKISTRRLQFTHRDDAGSLTQLTAASDLRPVANDSWHSILLKKANQAIKIYVDDVLDIDASVSGNDTLTATSLVSQLGEDPADTAADLTANIQHLAIFNRELTESEGTKLTRLAGLA